jgi:DNA-directed RNA polymerase sigma subunit (sigma70/sigma32)
VLADETLSAQEKLLVIIRRLPFRHPKKLTLDMIGRYMRLTTRRVKQIGASLRRQRKL